MKTIVRTNQLGSELLQTFINKLGLSPIFNMVLDGYSFGGDRIYDSTIDKSSFPNATDFGNNNPNAQSLWRVVNRDDTGNRYIQWFDYDKPSIPSNTDIYGIYHRILNDAHGVICNIVDVVPVTSTFQPIGYFYWERGKTDFARPFYVQDAGVTNIANAPTNWVGYTSYFSGFDGIGFRAIKTGGGATAYKESKGYFANIYANSSDTTNDAKFGMLVNVIGLNTSPSPAWMRGVTVRYFNNLPNANTNSYVGYMHQFIAPVTFNVGSDNVAFLDNMQGVTMAQGFWTGFQSGRGASTIIQGSDYGFHSQYYGATLDVAGSRHAFVDGWNGSANLNGTAYGLLENLANVNINGSYFGIYQTFLPTGVVGASALINARYVEINNNIAPKINEALDIYASTESYTSGNINAIQLGALGGATSANVFNSFTQRFVSSNYNTTSQAPENHYWDLRAIGVSGSDPVNSRFAIIGNGSEKFSIQMNGNIQMNSDIEVITSGKGLILKSPIGNRFRVVVDDLGNLSTQPV